MRYLLAAVILAAAIATYAPPAPTTAADTGTVVLKSTEWRQSWDAYPFPADTSKTPLFVTRAVQLPLTIHPGDLLTINGREEFSNPSAAAGPTCNGHPCAPWNSYGARAREHWSTPMMMGCGLVRHVGDYTADPDAWEWVGHPVAENFDGKDHHHVWIDTELREATDDDAGAWYGVICYFGRSPAFRDPDADYVQAHPDYGKVEVATIATEDTDTP